MSEEPRRVTRFVWERAFREAEGLHTTVKAVALIASTYASSGGGCMFPGAARLARQAGCGPQTAHRALKTLRDTGWLTRVEHANGRPGAGGGRMADVYALSVPAHVKLPAMKVKAVSDEPKPRNPFFDFDDAPRHLVVTGDMG